MPETFRLMDRCPGSAGIRTPTLRVRKCPTCGEEIEIFSKEVSATCWKCSIRWCRYAEECVGPDLVMRFR